MAYKNELVKELNKYNEIKSYLQKISSLFDENNKRINIINNSISKNCNIVNPLIKLKQDFIVNREYIENLIKKVDEKIKNITIDINKGL